MPSSSTRGHGKNPWREPVGMQESKSKFRNSIAICWVAQIVPSRIGNAAGNEMDATITQRNIHPSNVSRLTACGIASKRPFWGNLEFQAVGSPWVIILLERVIDTDYGAHPTVGVEPMRAGGPASIRSATQNAGRVHLSIKDRVAQPVCVASKIIVAARAVRVPTCL